jgi:hypothetical protein
MTIAPVGPLLWQSSWADSALESQTVRDTVDVVNVMSAFHEAVVKHDADRLSGLFIPEGGTWINVLKHEPHARMKAANPAQTKMRVSSYKEFAKFLSGSKANLDPQHQHVQVHSDGTIASVYFDFVFMIDGKVENHGSETWQLVKGVDEWRIVAITYSSEPKA